LARTLRVLLPLGEEAIERGQDVLPRIDLAQVNDRVLRAAGPLLPADLRSLDAIPWPRLSSSALTWRGLFSTTIGWSVAAEILGLAVTAPS
jgi:hypothetical protein